MVTLTTAELEEIHEYLSEYMHTEEAQSMKDFCQHGAVSPYDHVMHVVRLSYYQRALSNARRLFILNEKEQAIIRQHMWPLTLRAIPSCRESLIVCLSDKISSTMETLFQRK